MLHRYSLRLFKEFKTKTTVVVGCRCLATSSATDEFLARVGGRRKTVDAEIKKPDSEFYTDQPEYPPISVPFGSRGPEATKFDKKEYAEFVKSLPTVEEKLFAVNPYERPWTLGERRFHRDYMHGQKNVASHSVGISPRAIFRVNPIPDHYNLLPFYQYITRTHCVDTLPEAFYDGQKNIDREIEEFIPLATEAIQNEQKSFRDRGFSSNDYIYNIVDQLTIAASTLFSADFPHLAEAQITRNATLQAFWVRGGFHTLYPEDDPKPVHRFDDGWGTELLGDDRRKQGEFAFCLREKLGLSVRNKHPLPEIVKLDDPLCRAAVQPYVYAPLTLGLYPDKEGATFMTPGFEYGDPYEFNSVNFYSTDDIVKNIIRYAGAPASECYDDCVRSAAVALSFASLIGQAHYLGFTQHNDLTYPLTTQLILTDGQSWHFAAYQLNSIGLINRFEEADSLTNLVWCSDSMKLFDSVDADTGAQGLNKDVLKLVLKFLLIEPKERSDLEMRPYLINKATADERALLSAQVQAKAARGLAAYE